MTSGLSMLTSEVAMCVTRVKAFPGQKDPASSFMHKTPRFSYKETERNGIWRWNHAPMPDIFCDFTSVSVQTISPVRRSIIILHPQGQTRAQARQNFLAGLYKRGFIVFVK